MFEYSYAFGTKIYTYKGVTRFDRYLFPVILKANNLTCTKQTPDLNLMRPQGNYLQKPNVKTKMKQD